MYIKNIQGLCHELSIILVFSLYNIGSDHNTENILCLAMRLHIENISCDTSFIAACMYCRRCLAMGLLYFLVANLLRVCLPSRSQAVGLHVTMWLRNSNPYIIFYSLLSWFRASSVLMNALNFYTKRSNIICSKKNLPLSSLLLVIIAVV